MAEETQTKAEEATAQEVAVSEASPPAAEEKGVVKEPPQPPPPAPEPEDDPKKSVAEPTPAADDAAEEKKASAGEPQEKGKISAGARAVPPTVSFKEESNLVSDLADPEKKALDELKQLVRAALAGGEFSPAPPPTPSPAAASAPAEERPMAKTEEPISELPVSAEPPKPAPKEEEAPQPLTSEEKLAMVDEDGAKRVEAIEETVVPVAAPPLAEETAPAAAEKAPAPPALEEVLIWGVPLLSDDRSDTILLKFLRARDFKVKDAMAMLKNAVLWRKEFGIEALLEEDLGVPGMERAVFMHGVDKEGHPVCYNVYGEFQNKELYAAAFADAEKRQRFLRWRIQFLEKGIRELLDFKPDGVSTMVQVTDLKNSPGPAKRELRQALALLQDNYPEFAAKQVFVNVPWWYLAFNRMISPFFTQRTKSKFVSAGPSKSAETLFKYIAPEQVPVQYGGLSKQNDPEFSVADAVAEITLKPSMKQIIEIPVTETCVLVWELRVLGWELTYGAEFVPADGYTVIIQKARKYIATDEPVIKNSFKVGEAGKVLLTVDNTTSKKKKLLYRYKAKSSTA